LLHELREAGLSYETQKVFRVVYKAVSLDCGFRLDLIVQNTVVVEVKSIAQVLTFTVPAEAAGHPVRAKE
jgi:GxxExxY protein